MRRYAVLLMTVVVFASLAFAAYAGHENVVFPYEGSFGHYETMPQPDSGDLRHYVTSHMPYKKEFTIFPGTTEMYEGTEPHGSFLTVYVNDIALKSVKNKKYSNNSIILKENYSPEKKLAAITVMYKVNGYNPEGGDWFWVEYDPAFKVLKEGKVKGCLDCHSKTKGSDYTFTGK